MIQPAPRGRLARRRRAPAGRFDRSSGPCRSRAAVTAFRRAAARMLSLAPERAGHWTLAPTTLSQPLVIASFEAACSSRVGNTAAS